MSKTIQTISIPKVGTLITKRPDKMPYEKYRELLREQKKFLKGYNVVVGTNPAGKPIIEHIMGRLEGTLIPSHQYKNGRNPQIIIK